ncbi:hypothetical protein LIA77_04362 [Sarocladium implicatum]|nr:hypothetical protein LIA77_04362 [Sarocladium implicatum]
MNQGTSRGRGDWEDGGISIRNPGPWDERGTKPDAADPSHLWSKIGPYEVHCKVHAHQQPTHHHHHLPSPRSPFDINGSSTYLGALGYELSAPWDCLTRPGPWCGYGTSKRKRQGCARWCVSGPRTRRLHPFSFAFHPHFFSTRRPPSFWYHPLPGYWGPCLSRMDLLGFRAPLPGWAWLGRSTVPRYTLGLVLVWGEKERPAR